MRELNNGIKIIGIDHGYGNIKTANTVTPTGIHVYDTEPIFQGNILEYMGKYYRFGEGHKAFIADKSSDEDFYMFTLMAVARELQRVGIYEARVYIATGLPLTWVRAQRDRFKAYLMKNAEVSFRFNEKDFRISFVGCSVYPQGYPAIVERISDFKGTNILADIGNGTMNILYILNKKPLESKSWTEKLGVNQLVIKAKNAVMDNFGVKIDESIVEQFIRFGKADIGVKYSELLHRTAVEYTITLSDLSDADVNTSIRYGESANKCNLTSAPNYTEAGYYPVYYEITYRYADASMKENGVSYVWLLADNSSSKVQSDTATPHVHDYRFLETVRPTCTELGYDRFQCSICGALQKTNYVPALGHDYQTVVIREASCQQGGLELHSCNKCGAFYTESTSMTNHKYQTADVAATCTTNGYTEHKCIDCGYKYVTDLTPLAKHDYRTQVTEPTCTGRGFTTYICSECGDTYVSDYKDATGHEWDNGHEITHATCNGEGLLEYNCKHCDATKREAKSATGHTPGAAATCTEPQTCTVCGAILELPKGHHYSEAVTVPTCTTMGFTTYTCDDCGKSYVGNYTDKTEHHYDSVITPATCTAMGYTTYTCTECGNEYTKYGAVEITFQRQLGKHCR